MLWTTLKLAIRHLRSEKGYSIINVFGLSLGIACAITFFLFAKSELSYNRMFEKDEQIYRANTWWHDLNSDPEYFYHVTARMAPYMAKKFPGIENYTRVCNESANTRFDGNTFYDHAVHCVDSMFFDMFDFEVLYGTKAQFIKDYNSVVLSEKYAKKHFKDEDPVGKMIELSFLGGEYESFRVDGVLKSKGENHSFQGELFLSIDVPFREYFKDGGRDSWTIQWSSTYLEVAESSSAAQIEALINNQAEESGMLEWCREHGFEFNFHLQPINDLYLGLNNPRNMPTESSPLGLIVMFACGMAILILAIINYTTLSLGRMFTRLREVGMQKVLGAGSLTIQYHLLVESILITAIAILIGLVLAEPLLALTSDMIGYELQLGFSLEMLLFLMLTGMLVVIVGATYPSWLLSRFQVVSILDGDVKLGGRGRMRRVLTTIQVSVSILLVSLTLIMASQIHHIMNKDLGYQKERVVALKLPSAEDECRIAMQRFKNDMEAEPGIEMVSGSSCIFGKNWNEIGWVGDNSGIPFVYQNTIDYDYLDLMQINLLEGRNFSHDYPEDWNHSIIINSAFARQMDWEAPLGQYLPEKYGSKKVIGVVEDFHFHDLRTGIKPLVLFLNHEFYKHANRRNIEGISPDLQYILVRLGSEDVLGTMKKIEKYWKSSFPEHNYNPKFVNDYLNKVYEDDKRWLKVISLATTLAIIIALLGILGLSVLHVSRRKKEVVIRKVLGASIFSLLNLLSREVTYISIISLALAWPASLLIAERWIGSYTYKINLHYGYFLGAGAIIILLTLITVNILSLTVVNNNPADSLRQE